MRLESGSGSKPAEQANPDSSNLRQRNERDLAARSNWWRLCGTFQILIAAFAIPASVGQAHQAAAPGLAPTPPMGWASWNYYFCDYNEQTIRAQADALVSTRLRVLGYRYLIVQECIAPTRDEAGRIVPDPHRFPHGMAALVEYIHSRGLKAGIYTDVGPFTCFSKTHYQGSYNHEEQDARTFADWGIDLIEVDFCNKPAEHTAKELYGRMDEAIRKTGRPMLLYVCSWGEEHPWEWAPGVAQLWRTTEDISYEAAQVKWESVVRNFELNAQHAGFTAPNSWNDPDMLEVGNRGLNDDEARSHFSMWVVSAAPLWLGTDLTHIDASVRAMLTNAEFIAVDQDSLGAGVRRISGEPGGVEVWAKPLGHWTGATQAVLLLNLTSSKAAAEVSWRDLGLLPSAAVRDLWAHKNLGAFPEAYSTELPAHGSALLKITGKPSPERSSVYEAEWPGNVRPQSAAVIPCPQCSGGYGLSLPASSDTDSSALIFPQVDSEEDGFYELSLRSPNIGGDARVTVSVNGSMLVPLQPANGTSTSGTMSVKVKLRSGRNTVRIHSGTPIILDCLILRRG